MGHALDPVRLAHVLERHDRALDEARHEVPLGLDERHHLGPDADGSSRERGLVLDGAVDPERVGVAPGDAEHVRPAGRVDLEVVIGDAAAEHLDPWLLAGPDAGDDRLDLHPTILSRLREGVPPAVVVLFLYRLSRADRNHRIIGLDRNGPHGRARRTPGTTSSTSSATHRPGRHEVQWDIDAGTSTPMRSRASRRSSISPARTSASAGATTSGAACSTHASRARD